MTELPAYQYRGARNLVLLHEDELREFVGTWRSAKRAALPLPQTSDPNYESLEHLLFHVLRAAGSYMTWMCKNLGLPSPGIEPAPDVASIEAEADRYVDHLCERWRAPLADIPEAKFENPTYESNWGVHYCIDAMLEHAVMHPKRHRFQLRELLAARGASR